MSRICSLREAVATIRPGCTVTFGGFQLNRAPMALVRELIRQKKKRLRLHLLPNPLPLDFLVGAGAVSFADVAFAGLEMGHRSLVPPNWQAAVARNGLRWRERDALYLVQALRAAGLGTPFLPLPVPPGSTPQADVARVRDPFRGCTVSVVRALELEVALVHAQAADRHGNVWIDDPVTDELVIRASRSVIVTAEKIVPRLRHASIPSMLVSFVVHAPRGAWPTACAGYYGHDVGHLTEYVALARAGRFRDYLRRYVSGTERGGP
ncbi:CoA transferase subunit A [Acidobacteriia bacterium AH_259_A11_L15]|nr:CoA transferase subunit A [Acidobacteriia bacterium AH_259_A11_L15]